MRRVTQPGTSRNIRRPMRPAHAKRPGALSNPDATVAFLVPWGSAGAARLAVAALRSSLAVKTTDRAFTLSGRDYPAGTLIFDVADNEASLAGALGGLARDTGAEASREPGARHEASRNRVAVSGAGMHVHHSPSGTPPAICRAGLRPPIGKG